VSRPGGRRDRGSASIWLLGIGLTAVSFAVAVMLAGDVLVARHRARNAADLGALAGAPYAGSGAAVACERAGRVVAAGHGRLVECHLDELDLFVTVGVEGPAGFGDVRVTARAGQIR
jgi:secretion/DNA translocation related TadE-like protein